MGPIPGAHRGTLKQAGHHLTGVFVHQLQQGPVQALEGFLHPDRGQVSVDGPHDAQHLEGRQG